MNQRLNNFEFGKSFDVHSRQKLEDYLCQVWQKFQQEKDLIVDDQEFPKKQGFLSFDGNTARARNYIGFIQGEGDHIEIYPKVFKDKEISKPAILKHLFYWFDYCRKWKFPFSDVQLNSLDDVELPELIINLIANKIFEVISISPISLYEEVEEALLMPKGSINFGRYINNSLSNGNFHVLECDHEPLQYDNRLNRAIKYVSRILISKAKFAETRRKLEDILFILDDVEDCFCTAEMLDRINVNAFFSDYETVIGLCKMVLAQQVYNHHHDEKSHWSLLLPMEYVFEDFIAGFLARHFSGEWQVKYQKSDMYLVDDEIFKMQHDIFLTLKSNPNVSVIIDTKYKLRGKFKADSKKGVSQEDLYQMTSYAFRRGCNNVLLLYPNQGATCEEQDTFSISSFNNSQKIAVHAAEVPFWNINGHGAITEQLKNKLNELLDAFKNG
ncbi:MAG: restriction endonuclease [Sphingobacteriaceae bacterium]|nr:restriction endonuclease [Sphingobacteriaceae bacterium]